MAMSLIDDPDVKRWLELSGHRDNEDDDENKPKPYEAFANDPDVLAFAGLPPPQAPAQIDRFNAGQSPYVLPAVTPGPEAYLKDDVQQPGPSPQVQAFVESVRKQNEPPQTPASPLAPVRGVPQPLQAQAANVVQTRENADEAAIRAKEEELRIMRESLANRRGQLEADRLVREEEAQRQSATEQQLQQQLTEIGQEKDAPLEPGRFVANMGTGGTLFAAALAFAHGFMQPNDRSNPVAQVIQNGIERDIHAQELAIRNTKDQRQTRLGILEKRLGDTQAARARLRIELADITEKQLDAETKDTQAQISQEGIAATKQALAAERAKGVMELQQALYRMQPKAAGAGKTPAQRAEETAKLISAGYSPERAAALAGGEAPTGKSDRVVAREDAAEAKAGERQEKRIDAARQDYAKDTRTLQERENATVRAAKAFGLTATRGPDGRYVVSGSADEPHVGDSAVEKESALGEMSKADTMAMSREPSARLQDQYSQLSKPPFRDALKKKFFQEKLDAIEKTRVDIEMQYDPDVLEFLKEPRDQRPMGPSGRRVQ